MKKDLSKVIEQYVYSHLYHRDDILVQVLKSPTRYNVHIIVQLKPTDGLWATIHKGVDRQDLMRGLKDYLNLDWDSCMIFCQLKDN
jgi:hypothetical protein